MSSRVRIGTFIVVQRVPAGAERIERLAVAEEDRLLVLLHDELRAELDVGRAFRRNAMDERAVGLVEEVDDFQLQAHGRLQKSEDRQSRMSKVK